MKKNMESWILWKIYIKTTFWLILGRGAQTKRSFRRVNSIRCVQSGDLSSITTSHFRQEQESCGKKTVNMIVHADRHRATSCVIADLSTVDTRDILSYRSRTARLQRSDTYISRTLSSCVSPLHTIDVGSESLILPSISSMRNAVRMSPRLWSRSRTLFRSSPKQHRPIPCRTFFHWVLTFLHIPLQRLELGAHNSPVLHLVIEFVSTDQIQLIRDSVLLCISIKICMIHIHLTLTGHADRIPLRRRDCYRSFESRIR